MRLKGNDASPDLHKIRIVLPYILALHTHMKDFIRQGLAGICVCTLVIFSGCDHGGKESVGGGGTGSTIPSPYPEIRGSWSGSFYRTDVLGSTSVNATIGQDIEAVNIRIAGLLPGLANSFIGTITIRGDMSLTDGYDGEHWTTYYGPATADFIKIADFIVPPSTENPHPPLHIIELRR